MITVARQLETLRDRIQYGNITRDEVDSTLDRCIDELLENETGDNGVV